MRLWGNAHISEGTLSHVEAYILWDFIRIVVQYKGIWKCICACSNEPNISLLDIFINMSGILLPLHFIVIIIFISYVTVSSSQSCHAIYIWFNARKLSEEILQYFLFFLKKKGLEFYFSCLQRDWNTKSFFKKNKNTIITLRSWTDRHFVTSNLGLHCLALSSF